MEGNEQLIRVGIILEELGKKVTELTSRIENMKTDSRLAVAEEQISRLSTIVYAAIGGLIAQLIAIVIMLVKK